jgi:NarL family two-component system response regulator LiaR
MGSDKPPSNTEQPCCVLVVDDHAMVREGLLGFLLAFDDLKPVGEASNGKEALHLCARCHPDVVLMDIAMPIMDGLAATRAIRRNYPDVQVIVLTNFGDEELVQAALEAGAIGYLLKDASAEKLADAIRAANVGRL